MHSTVIKSKYVLKTAFREAIAEKQDVFNNIIAEVLEDIAIGKAIDEGLDSGIAKKEDVFQALKSK